VQFEVLPVGVSWRNSSAVAPDTAEPIVASWKAMTSVSPDDRGRKVVGQAEPVVALLAGGT